MEMCGRLVWPTLAFVVRGAARHGTHHSLTCIISDRIGLHTVLANFTEKNEPHIRCYGRKIPNHATVYLVELN